MNTITIPGHRDRIAQAVHLAVTDVTEDSGVGHCDLYALAGSILLTRLTGERHPIQVGSMLYHADPVDNGWFEIDARNGGIDRREFHAWIGRPGEKRAPGVYEVGELIDFSVRHLQAMVKTMQQISSVHDCGGLLILTYDSDSPRISWTRPDGPRIIFGLQEIRSPTNTAIGSTWTVRSSCIGCSKRIQTWSPRSPRASLNAITKLLDLTGRPT